MNDLTQELEQPKAQTTGLSSALSLDLDKLNACIHCGMCLPACATYRATGSEAESPRGRLYLMKKVLQNEIAEPASIEKHLDQCLACHACETVCPSGVQYGDLLFATREQLAKNKTDFKSKLKRFIFSKILPNHKLLQASAKLLKVYQRSGLKPWFEKSLLLNSVLVRLAPVLKPMLALLPDVGTHKAFNVGMSFGNPEGERVVLLLGCVMDVFFNPVHWATVRALSANGYYVTIPEQTCCGALAHHAGEVEITRQLARENIRLMLSHYPDWVVLNSAGCGSSMKAYGELLKDDPVYAEKAAVFSERVIDVVALLAKRQEEGSLAPFTVKVRRNVVYHAACHLQHVQGLKTEVQTVLSGIAGLNLVPLTESDLCCGSAGIYNLEHSQIADDILNLQIGNLKLALAQHQADTLVSGNPGCLMQWQKGLKASGVSIRLQHPIELIAEAYGG